MPIAGAVALTKGSRATTRRTRPTSSAAMPMPSSSWRTCSRHGSPFSSARAASARARSCTPVSRLACGRWAISSSSCSPTGAGTLRHRSPPRCERRAVSTRGPPTSDSLPRSRRAPNGPGATWSWCSTSSRSTSSTTSSVRTPFALEFPRAITQADLPVSFLIAIREDALARLERFKGVIPGLFDTYLRLDRLDRDAAREAIVAPLARRAASIPTTPSPRSPHS